MDVIEVPNVSTFLAELLAKQMNLIGVSFSWKREKQKKERKRKSEGHAKRTA